MVPNPVSYELDVFCASAESFKVVVFGILKVVVGPGSVPFFHISACSDFTRRETEDTPYLPQGFIAKPQAEKKGAGEGTGRFP